jgi:ribosomal protein L16 Arg81 hydroxylase
MSSIVPSSSAPRTARERLSFAEIVAPIDTREFLSRFWTREAVLMRHPGRTFEPYFGWAALNAVLNTTDLGASAVKIARNDRGLASEEYTTTIGSRTVVNPRSVMALFDDGASLGINGADAYWPPLRAVLDGVYDALWESPHANVYCSPPSTQGFHCHFDLHEVLVLQIEGTKRWRVFRPTTEAPVTSWRMADAPAVLATEPYLDVVLQRGDVLHVPRGHWHYATTENSISMHVTVGVSCRKATTFLEWLIDELKREPLWRRNMPLLNPAIMSAAEQSNTRASWGEQLRQDLSTRLAMPDIFERYLRDTTEGVQPRRTFSLPFQAAESVIPIETLIFERPTGRHHLIAEHGDTVTVSAAGCELQLEGVSRQLLSAIFEAESFTAAEIRTTFPDVIRDELEQLLGELVRLGLILAHSRQ